MSDVPSGLSGRARELRLAFDRGFTEPLHRDAAPSVALLAIRVGGEPCAIRLAAIAGLHADKVVTPVPGTDRTLLGMAGFRGAILPVYSLAALLGNLPGETVPRWLVIVAAAPVAFAFESLEGHLNVPRQAILASPPRAFVRNHVQTDGFSGPILNVPALLDGIKRQRDEPAPKEEQEPCWATGASTAS